MTENVRARSAFLVEHGVVSGSDKARALGRWLGDERRRRGLRQGQAAAEIGVSGSILGTWETGVGVPGAMSMERLRKWLGKARWSALVEHVEALGAEAREPAGAPVGGGRRGKRAAKVVTAEDVLAVIMSWEDGPAAGRGVLCGAVVALSAGAAIEVEIRVRA